VPATAIIVMGGARVAVPPERPFLDTFRGNLKETFFPDDPFRAVVRERGCWRRAVAALRFFFPFMEWVPAYRPGTFKSDLIAGVTIASLAIPQGISYAKLANLPPILGLCKHDYSIVWAGTVIIILLVPFYLSLTS
jgi:sulfate transporter 3